MIDININFNNLETAFNIIGLLTLLVLILTLMFQFYQWRITLLKDKYYQIINDIYIYCNNLPSTESRYKDKYLIKNGNSVEYKVKEYISPIGLENFRIWAYFITDLYNGRNLYEKYYNKENNTIKHEELLWFNKSVYGIYLLPYCIKLIHLFEISRKLDNNLINIINSDKNNQYVEYSCSIINNYQKFIITYFYFYDKNFRGEFKDLIEKYKIINYGDFDSLITGNDKELENIYRLLNLK